jgi:hypothetical protein
MADTDKKQEETYSDAETVARAEATLKRMLATPPRPHKLGGKAETTPPRRSHHEGQNKPR